MLICSMCRCWQFTHSRQLSIFCCLLTHFSFVGRSNISVNKISGYIKGQMQVSALGGRHRFSGSREEGEANTRCKPLGKITLNQSNLTSKL